MKVVNWIVALLGLWEFADIAALFVPEFGKIPDYLWNHIIVGLIFIIVGVGAARTNNVRTATTMNWIAAGASIWLVISSFIMRYPIIGGGFWNDLIVGVLAFVLSVWVARASS